MGGRGFPVNPGSILRNSADNNPSSHHCIRKGINQAGRHRVAKSQQISRELGRGGFLSCYLRIAYLIGDGVLELSASGHPVDGVFHCVHLTVVKRGVRHPLPALRQPDGVVRTQHFLCNNNQINNENHPTVSSLQPLTLFQILNRSMTNV